jgi:hypothetical protein
VRNWRTDLSLFTLAAELKNRAGHLTQREVTEFETAMSAWSAP